MDRLERVRQAIDGILQQQPNLRYRHGAYIHLYGVSVNCALLALKRGLDMELAQVAGMLHDISTYQRSDGTDHDRFSAQAAEGLLGELGLFSQPEVDAIYGAILHHRAKLEVHAPLDELLKDADALHHYLYNPGFEQAAKDEARIAAVLAELGVE
jgi:HD superfamily phosphodiesterase